MSDAPGNAERASFRSRRKRWRRALLRHCTDCMLQLSGKQPSMKPDHADHFDPHSILILRPNHRLGNTLLLTPLLVELQTLWPAARVDVLSAGRAQFIFSAFANVDRVLILPQKAVRHPLHLLKLLKLLRARTYDLVINPCSHSQSARLLAAMTHARNLLDCSFTSTTVTPTTVHDRQVPQHMAQRPIHLLRQRYAPSACHLPYPTLSLPLDENLRAGGRSDLAQALPALNTARMVIGLYTEATGSKRIPLAWWHTLLHSLRNRSAEVAMVEILPLHGTPSLAEDLPGIHASSIPVLAAQLAALDVLITGDCGVMHLACAVGTTTMGIFHNSDLATYTPYGGNNYGFALTQTSPAEIADRVLIDRH